MDKTIEYYLGLPYTIELKEDSEAGWFVKVKELPGCMSQGETAAEALEMIQEAMALWLEVALEDGDPIPEPRELDDYSGKFVVRVPRSLHRDLVDQAQVEGVSLNQLVNVALARAVRAPHAAEAFSAAEHDSSERVRTYRQALDLWRTVAEDAEGYAAPTGADIRKFWREFERALKLPPGDRPTEAGRAGRVREAARRELLAIAAETEISTRGRIREWLERMAEDGSPVEQEYARDWLDRLVGERLTSVRAGQRGKTGA